MGKLVSGRSQRLLRRSSYLLSGVALVLVAAACSSSTEFVLNLDPQVAAGDDQTVSGSTANLNGTVTDDGRPDPPAAVTTAWTRVSGPGTVAFGDAAAVDTIATFSAPGVYVLRLTANDSALTRFDEVQITAGGGQGQ